MQKRTNDFLGGLTPTLNTLGQFFDLDDAGLLFQNLLRNDPTPSPITENLKTGIPMDIWVDDSTGHAYVEVSIIGAEKGDIKVSVPPRINDLASKTIRIKYEKKNNPLVAKEPVRRYQVKNISRKDLDVSIAFSEVYDLEKLEPKYENNLLTIRIPKLKEQPKPQERFFNIG